MEEKDIVDRIEELCKANKTSIYGLERELGFANATIRKWRNTKNKPSLEKVMAIAEILHTTPEYLYTGEGAKEAEMTPIKDILYKRILAMSDEEAAYVLGRIDSGLGFNEK